MMAMGQVTPDALIAWQVVLTLGVLVAIGANLASIVNYRRSQKREVSFSLQPTSKEEFEKHMSRCIGEQEKLWIKLTSIEADTTRVLDQKLDRMREEGRADRHELRETINEVANKVSGLEVAGELHNQRLSEVNAKLDRVIERNRRMDE